MRTLLIEVYLDKKITKADLHLRHMLVDTIEKRSIGEVVEQTSCQEMMEVILEASIDENIEDKLKSLLVSLGFSQYNIKDITFDKED